MFKKNLPYMLNISYLTIFILYTLYCIYAYLFDDNFLRTYGKETSFDVLMRLPWLFLGIFLFIMSIRIAKKTKLNWLHFGSLYLSGQIFFIILFTASTSMINKMFSIGFFSVFLPIIFWAIKVAQYVEVPTTDISKITNIKTILMKLSKKILPYTLNLPYLAFFILMAISSISDFSSKPIEYNKDMHISFFGIFLFTAAIIIAYKTKLKWLRFLSLYLLGQIYIVLALTYVELMNKVIIPMLKN